MRSIALLAEAVRVSGNGSDLIHQIFVVLILSVCLVMLWFAGDWCFKKMGVPAIALTIWMGLFLLIALVVVLNFLMGLIGHSFLVM
jgi:RsiW-degrading membrane proteinase PrsW (M82 family)